MARSGPETLLVRNQVAALRVEYPDGWFTKIHGGPYQTAGIPDIIGCVFGRFIAIESKALRPGESPVAAYGRVTRIQRAILDKLAKAGAVTGVAVSVQDALDIVATVVDR